MLLKKLSTIITLLTFFSCHEENPLARKEEWVLTKWYANSTSCCFAFDDNGNIEVEQSHPVFDALLGLKDQGVHEQCYPSENQTPFQFSKMVIQSWMETWKMSNKICD